MRFTTKGYKYSNEESANDSINLLNVHFNIPKNANCLTRSYAEADISYDKDKKIDFYYIIFDPSMIIVLGDPTEFTVNTLE